MYNSAGDLHKIEYMQANKFLQSKFVYTQRQVNLLEQSKLSLDTKIEILEIFAGIRFLTEQIIDNDEQELCDLLSKLDLSFYKSSKISKKNNSEFFFLVVASNQAVLEYVRRFENELNDFELGILYGYHHKSILAFAGLLKQKQLENNPSTPYLRYLSKVMSEDYFEEEDAHYSKNWETVKSISPKTILTAEIRHMFEQDQQVRNTEEIDWEKLAEIDTRNTARMKEIIEEYGWISPNKFGIKTANNAWFLIQHADNDIDFQEQCLELMKSQDEQDMNPKQIAYLEDRVLVARNKKQKYGTQLVDRGDYLIVKAVKDINKLEQRRKKVGFSTMSDYFKQFDKPVYLEDPNKD